MDGLCRAEAANVKLKVQGEVSFRRSYAARCARWKGSRLVVHRACTACWVQGLDQQIWIRPARIRSRGVAGDMSPIARCDRISRVADRGSLSFARY